MLSYMKNNMIFIDDIICIKRIFKMLQNDTHMIL